MAYTVLKLIADAYYESGIVARSFETVTGEQFSDGLNYFNQVLGMKLIDDGSLPYYVKYDFDLVAGQQTYFIENLTEVESAVFFKDEVRYSIANMKRRDYWGSPRTEGIETLPVYYTVDRVLGGSNISFYFFPDENYPVQIWGQFGLESATLNQDLLELYDNYYIAYLRYSLVPLLCAANSMPVPEGIIVQLQKYDRAIRKRSGYLDMQCTCLSTIGAATSLNYGQVNIGRGYTTLSR